MTPSELLPCDDKLASKIKSYLCNELHIDITSYGADKLSDFILSLGYRPSSSRREMGVSLDVKEMNKIDEIIAAGPPKDKSMKEIIQDVLDNLKLPNGVRIFCSPAWSVEEYFYKRNLIVEAIIRSVGVSEEEVLNVVKATINEWSPYKMGGLPYNVMGQDLEKMLAKAIIQKLGQGDGK